VIEVTVRFVAADIASVLNAFILMLQGNVVLAAATLAIMVVGYLWMTGRLEVMKAITIVLGIAVVGSAATIAQSLVGSGGS
jgi:type IV secretory pathway VirB2 component (pilin)